jgi:hypothetical protein
MLNKLLNFSRLEGVNSDDWRNLLLKLPLHFRRALRSEK